MANPVVNIESTALAAAGARGVAIGVHVHAEPERLRETLDALSARTPGPYELLLLVDGPDAETRGALAQWTHVRQSATAAPQGASACFNRLARETAAPILVFLESGTLVGPGWLEQLLGALDADLAHGLSCPSTNRAWNQLAQYPGRRGEIVEIERAAADAQRRFGGAWSKLTPLLDVADFCLALRREAYDAAGPADEGFGLGPCWEMDFSARAARAGFASVWAQGAYVFRHPPTARRAREEARLFETSRRRYQDKVCGMRRQNPRAPYASHCKGEACRHFAPEAKPTTATRGAAQLVCRPLVSCVMPTKGRPEFMLQSIRYFQRQTCPDLELIIVDASPRSLAPFLPDDPRIRHFSVASRLSLGAMRNFGSEQASGEILVQWDDDDWYGPERLSAQVQPIRDGVADITGLTDTRFFVLDQWKFWLCSPELHRRMFRLDVSGGTLAFRRSLFGAQCRYPDASLAEDAAFLQQAVHSGARLKRLPSAEHYLYLRHAGNTWSFQCGQFLDPSGWIAHAEPEFLHDDRSFYVARSAAKAKGAFAACAIPTPVAPPALT
jgi:glycosyltransferase involved in cell wall biosynthesis